MVKILLVDDSLVDAKVIQNVLAAPGSNAFQLTHAISLQNTWPLIEKNTFDVILLDLFLPDSGGLDTVKRVIQHAPKTPIVVLTGLEDETVGLQAIQEGAQDYLVKGQRDLNLIGRVVRYAIERKKLLTELQEALANIKTLRGMLPICFRCKKIRNDKGFWDRLETYVQTHSEANFTHGLCPDCFDKEVASLPKP